MQISLKIMQIITHRFDGQAHFTRGRLEGVEQFVDRSTALELEGGTAAEVLTFCRQAAFVFLWQPVNAVNLTDSYHVNASVHLLSSSSSYR